MMNASGRMATGVTMAAAVLLGGCADLPEEEVGVVEIASTADNGIHMNGLIVNGIHMNGIHMNGLGINGTSLNGVYAKGMSLKQTSFSGTIQGKPVSGLGFIGARMTATMPNGSTLQLRINDIDPSADSEILLYDVSSSLDGVTWSPLCRDRAGAPVRSYPLKGYWDESEGTATGGDHIDDAAEFTFACQGYVLAKCTEMGYKPWRSVTECKSAGACHPVPLSFVHQACTRMLRADYCGDGTPTTRDGTRIDIADNFDFESSARVRSWLFEAEWGYDGATCIKNTRWLTIDGGDDDDKELKVRSYIDAHCPSRWAGPQSHFCGSFASNFYTKRGYTTPLTTRSLLMTRIDKREWSDVDKGKQHSDHDD
jgi:hypothetical protein